MIGKTSFIVILCTAALIMLGLSIISWRRRLSGNAAIYLSICLFSVAIYCFGYAMELHSETLQSAMFWVRFQHWGIDFIAPSWLLFALAVSGYEKRITKKLIIALFIIPVILFLVSQTLGWLNLGHHNPRLDMSGPFPVFTYDRNLYNYIIIGYYSVCLAISMVLYLAMYFRSAPSFRDQAVVYLIGSVPPWLALILYNLNLFPFQIDFTPLALGVSGAFFTIGFVKFKILEIIPLARDVIFENMKEGFLILDMENRVIDFNPVLQDIFPQVKESDVGSLFNHVFSNYPPLLTLVESEQNERIEFQLGVGEAAYFYRVNLSIVENKRGRQIGKIISFYEFTEEKHLMHKLERLAATDALTGIYNRQYFDELVRKEIARINRYGGELSLIMLDLDFFKSINDTYGHITGDRVLVAVVDTLQDILRQSDIIARFGGEEFLILAPQTSLSDAKDLAERLRMALEHSPIQLEGKELNVLASFGVTGVESGVDVTPEMLYRWADNGIYKAKSKGRNAVCVSLPSGSE
jgi:diguanylate cyclase (GGDEF)-like protein